MIPRDLLFLLEFASTWMMTGVLWMVQLLIYPAFRSVPKDAFRPFHEHHTRVITYVVAPTMLVELGAAIGLAYTYRDAFFVGNLAGVLALWALTGFVSVPLHEALPQAAEPAPLVKKLVATNWPRTLLWSARALALLIWGF